MTDTLTKTAGANAPINDTRKAELLSKQVKHIDIKSFDARPIVDAMADMSFTSRDLGRATNIYNQMLPWAIRRGLTPTQEEGAEVILRAGVGFVFEHHLPLNNPLSKPTLNPKP